MVYLLYLYLQMLTTSTIFYKVKLLLSHKPCELLLPHLELVGFKGRQPCMFFGADNMRNTIRHAFQGTMDEQGNLVEKDQPDILMGTAGRMETALNLTKASFVILMEPIYSSQLIIQIPKRARRWVCTYDLAIDC